MSYLARRRSEAAPPLSLGGVRLTTFSGAPLASMAGGIDAATSFGNPGGSESVEGGRQQRPQMGGSRRALDRTAPHLVHRFFMQRDRFRRRSGHCDAQADVWLFAKTKRTDGQHLGISHPEDLECVCGAPQAATLIEGLPAEVVMADTAYDADHLRQAIAAKGCSPSFPTTRHVRSNIRSTSIFMLSAISWSVASQNSSSSAASQPASKRQPEITGP
jgi:hypothetical protein